MRQQQPLNRQITAGKHPFLKLDGKPALFLPMPGSNSPECDLSNFSIDGKLGRLLQSPAFGRFMHPYMDSDDEPGRTIEQIWQWLTWELGLRRWKHQTASDLGWLEEHLQTLDFLVRRKINGHTRWCLEGC